VILGLLVVKVEILLDLVLVVMALGVEAGVEAVMVLLAVHQVEKLKFKKLKIS
jgi:hypothetical protein